MRAVDKRMADRLRRRGWTVEPPKCKRVDCPYALKEHFEHG